MKTISAVLVVVVAMAWPAVAQVSTQSPTSPVQLKTAAFQWDRDHDRDHDRDDYRGYGQYHNVLAPEWQQKFDSYYQRWLQYRATNNTGEMQSMEARMRDIMVNYKIPPNVPFGAVASPGIGGNNGYYGQGPYRGDDRRDGYFGNGDNGRYGYHNVLAPEWQQKFDSYYQRWLQYRATNNADEMRSMEGRMQSIMTNYKIPANTPYGEVASPGIGGYTRR